MALLNLTVDVPVHDPLIVKEGSAYYCFSTHGYFYTSSDLLSWKYGGKVFEKLPDWVFEFVPDSDGKDFMEPHVIGNERTLNYQSPGVFKTDRENKLTVTVTEKSGKQYKDTAKVFIDIE